MTRASEVVNFFVRLAANGQGVDKDRAYGFQCADVPTYAAYEYFGVHLWGNAIDLLHAAAGVGWEVVRTSSGQLPRIGAFFVKSYVGRDGIDYGHTGIIVEVLDRQTVRTVEQNLAGNLEHGSPAEYNTRKLSELIGWFYPPYEKEETHNSNTNTTTQLMEEEEMKNFVVRSKSGSQGYVGVVNGAVFGIGAIDTVGQLKAAGAIELNLDDGDYNRFLESQQFDDKKLVASIDDLKKAVVSKK